MLLAAGALLWAAGAAAAPRVIAGNAIDVQQAPWQVLVLVQEGSAYAMCGGSIIDSNRIVTAAHCATYSSGAPAPPNTYTIAAGISNFNAPKPSDVLQTRGVASVRIHPRYSTAHVGAPDDVAVLTLDAPLDLSGTHARAIALPSPGTIYPKGRTVNLAGFGQQSVSAPPDGQLYWISSTLTNPVPCGGTLNAIFLCAASPANAVCSGDSGSGLVMNGVLIGVASTGIDQCPKGSAGRFTNVAAPEVLLFIQGNDNPPIAPRQTRKVELDYPRAMQVGQTLTCYRGGWTGNPKLTFQFVNSANDAVLQRGSKTTFKLRQRDLGRKIRCIVAAKNAGGTAFGETTATGRAVRPGPKMKATPTVARRGEKAVIRVVLTGMAYVGGRAELCVKSSSRVAGKTCTKIRLQGNSRVIGMVPIRLKPNAPARKLRLGVSARFTDGRTFTAVGVLRVRS